MDLYFEMLKSPVFTMENVMAYYDNINTARSAIGALVKRNLVMRIRKNLYTCISGETGSPVANKYQIACAVNPAAYISHHTAMEYYGVCNQVYYDIYASSEKRFRSFSFNGYSYRCIMSKCRKGIENVEYSGGVRITSKERTVIDSIKDMEHISGMEEVIENLSGMSSLSEQKLLEYLQEYDNQFLYQKTGYLLYPYKNQMRLSKKFFDSCKKKIGQSKRYLSATVKITEGHYDDKWKLIVPDGPIYKAGMLKND